MNVTEILAKLNTIPEQEFISHSHTQTPHRLFGFVTTNIRRWTSFCDYIIKLVPEYLKASSPVAWKEWCFSPVNQQKYKQAFKRLELASLLFRNVENNPNLNILASKLYAELSTNQSEVLLFLALYLLKGRYWQIDKQPLIEINKILSLYVGDIEKDASAILREGRANRLLLATVLYNPSLTESENLSLTLLKEKDISELDCQKILSHPLIKKRIKNAGGLRNFYAEIFLIINFKIFKEACVYFAEEDLIQIKDKLISRYVETLYEKGMNSIPGVFDLAFNKKQALQSFLLRFFKYIQEVALFALNIKEEDFYQQHKPGRKANIKQKAMTRFGNECFFSYYGVDKLWHEQGYFQTRKNERYLEGHHVIQLEHFSLFNNDLDIMENIIPLCPNCHRKLHNAEEAVVAKMLRVIYTNIDKKSWIRRGIFVDIDTLCSFYGLSKDIEEYR